MYKLLILCCLFVVSCATFPQESKPPPNCLPKSAPPDILSWPVMSASTKIMSDKMGDLHVVVYVEYKRESKSIQVVWIDGFIGMIDMEPQNKDATFWYDTGVLIETSTLTIQPIPKPSCLWKEYFNKKT